MLGVPSTSRVPILTTLAADKFESCNVEDLAIKDVPLLLKDYRRLAALVRRTRAFLEDQL